MYEKQEPEQEKWYDTIGYITLEAAKMGNVQFDYYNTLIDQNNCRGNLTKPNKEYYDCMVDNANCALEKTIYLFNKIKQMKQDVRVRKKII